MNNDEQGESTNYNVMNNNKTSIGENCDNPAFEKKHGMTWDVMID